VNRLVVLAAGQRRNGRRRANRLDWRSTSAVVSSYVTQTVVAAGLRCADGADQAHRTTHRHTARPAWTSLFSALTLLITDGYPADASCAGGSCAGKLTAPLFAYSVALHILQQIIGWISGNVVAHRLTAWRIEQNITGRRRSGSGSRRNGCCLGVA